VKKAANSGRFQRKPQNPAEFGICSCVIRLVR